MHRNTHGVSAVLRAVLLRGADGVQQQTFGVDLARLACAGCWHCLSGSSHSGGSDQLEAQQQPQQPQQRTQQAGASTSGKSPTTGSIRSIGGTQPSAGILGSAPPDTLHGHTFFAKRPGSSASAAHATSTSNPSKLRSYAAQPAQSPAVHAHARDHAHAEGSDDMAYARASGSSSAAPSAAPQVQQEIPAFSADIHEWGATGGAARRSRQLPRLSHPEQHPEIERLWAGLMPQPAHGVSGGEAHQLRAADASSGEAELQARGGAVAPSSSAWAAAHELPARAEREPPYELLPRSVHSSVASAGAPAPTPTARGNTAQRSSATTSDAQPFARGAVPAPQPVNAPAATALIRDTDPFAPSASPAPSPAAAAAPDAEQTMHSKSIGSFASEEDAARGYEDAAGQAHGPGKPGALLGGTADDAAQHRIAVAAADAEPGAGASLSCGSEDGSVGLFYAATLREGYDAYCVALRACAAGRAGGSGGRKDRAWGSTAATSSPSVPTFEAYSRGVLAEMDAREAALHSEGARVRAAARRGATGEMPAARTLMAQWEESLTDAIKYDMKKLAGLLMSQTESDAATAAARARLGAAAGTGAKAATRQQLAEAAAAGASEQQALTHESLAQHRAQYHSLLFSLPPAVLAEITAQVAASTVLSVGNGGRVKFTRCAATVGDAVRDRLRHNELCSRVVEETEKRDAATKDRQKHKTKLSKERHKKEAGADESAVPEEVRYAALLQSAANDHQTATRCLKQLRELAAMVVPTSGRKGGRENLQKSVDRLLDLQGWTNADSVRIGGELLHALLRTATVTLPGTRAASTPTVPAPAAPHAPGAGAPHALAAGAAPHAPQAQQAVPGAAEGAGGVVVWPAQSDLDQTWRDAEREITPFVPRGTPASPWAGGGPADVRQQHALSSPQALPERLEQQQQHALSSPQPPPEQQQAERLPQLREVPAFVHAISPLQDVGMATSEESDNPWKGQIRAIGTLSLVDAAMSQLLSGSAKFYSGGQKLMPMLVPPRPWTHYRRGGHLTQSHDIARVPRKHAHRLRTAHENGELQRVYDALNILGEVPWRINTGILNVLEELGAASGATSTLGTSPQLPNVLAGFRAAVTGEGVPKRPTARTAAAAAAAKAETKAASAASMQVPGRGATTPAAAPASAASPTALRSAAAAARAAAATAARASEMSAVAQGVGLPDAIHPVPPLSHFAPRPGAQLRASREGLGGGQLLVSSGTPMRGERTFSMARRAEAHRAHMEALSIKTFFLYRVQLARELSSAPQFFFPHNLDFRGRAYPMHPYLHHMGDDVTRGLLTFARAKPLGADGLRWLKIHVANMWGHGEDKKPLAERAAFAEANLEAIAESVASPLAGKRWWAEAEKPWQLLAAIRELSSALSHPDGPEAFPSTLPVHQDGSCNGLQHYSALARDTTCAAAVNMLPADRPADVYSAVAAAVEARAKRDAAAGRSEATKLLERNGGVVDRKLVKQTVMTTVYGVTEIGARLQISHRLSERGWTNEAEVYQVSRYLAVSTFACLSEVFNNANAVKLWLRESAMRVAATGQEVAWVNPMGLPVSQPYMQLPRMVIRTSLQQAVILAPDHGPAAPATPAAGARAPSSYGARGLQAGGSDVAAAGAPSWASAPGVPMGNARAPGAVRAPGAPSHGTAGAAEADADFARVDKRAQTTAFPPNYIHGLDASHMMMTALACDRAGITFAGVHDSFWTHAGDVDAMGVLLRKEFVTLHNRPLLRELQAHLQAQLDVAAIAAKELAGAKKAAGEKRPAREKIAIVKDLPPIPATGDLNLTDIERSVYFFN